MTTEETIEITFEQLEQCLSMAMDRVPVSDPAEMLSWLPQKSEVTRQLILCELIKLDMSKASELGVPRYLEFYQDTLVDQFPHQRWPLDLVLEELQLQRDMSVLPSMETLRVKYPHLADALNELMTRTRSVSSRVPSNRLEPLQIDQQVDDFVIVRQLGKGAFAHVYLARQVSMHRLVALKISEHRSNESVVLSQLDHPNIVRVYDKRQMPGSTASMLYMQYVPGGTLAEVIQLARNTSIVARTGKILHEAVDAALVAAGQQAVESSPSREQFKRKPWAEVVATMGYQLAQGLAHAHSKSVTHRDLKPANILLSMEGTPKLADFNVSFVENVGTNAASHFGGSIAYMSPEQLEVVHPAGNVSAEELDGRSDLYALAILLWELWQGKRPWHTNMVTPTWNDAIQQQIKLRHEPIVPLHPSQSPSERVLEKTLKSALSHSRDERPADCETFGAKLKLATTPKAAALFEPKADSWLAWLGRLPILVVAIFIIFVPNGIAGAINFQFNQFQVMRRHPELRDEFGLISLVVNFVAFSAGGAILLWLIQQASNALKSAARGVAPQPSALDRLLNLGYLSAVIGGALWLVAGLIFPIALGRFEPKFELTDSTSFFVSLVGCGGMACIYPFFGLSYVALQTYYPKLISITMRDPAWLQRVRLLRLRANIFLVIAAVIPLALLGLLIASPEEHRFFQVICLGFTAMALGFAFAMYQQLIGLCQLLTEFLADKPNS